MRIAVQALSLALFTLLFALANYRLPDWLPADIYLRLDPLLGLSAIVAGREWIGRASGVSYCSLPRLSSAGSSAPTSARWEPSWISWIRVLFRRVERRDLDSDARLRHVKYVVLIVFIAAARSASSLVYLLDPIALLTRTYTFALFPPFVGLVNLGAGRRPPRRARPCAG